MSKEKQIEEMAVEFAKINCNPKGCYSCDLCDEYCSLELSCEDYLYYRKMAETFYNAGYRKQSEGEWTYENTLTCLVGTDAPIECRCTICGRLATNPWDFCPNCGAKMKGDDSIWNILQCSACGYVADTLCHCCPSCGAKMRGDTE